MLIIILVTSDLTRALCKIDVPRSQNQMESLCRVLSLVFVLHTEVKYRIYSAIRPGFPSLE